MFSGILLQILNKGDSAIISNLSTLSEKVEILSKKVSISPWISVVSTIVGGLLVLGAQYLDRWAKRKAEIKNELINLAAKSEMTYMSIKSALKELSTQKNLRIYWWYCYMDEHNAGANKDSEKEKKYLTDHYTACNAIIVCDLKIDQLLAEYYSNVSKFMILKKVDFDINFIKDLAVVYDFTDPKDIADGTSSDEALIQYENNSKELANEYFEQFKSLEQLNEKLKLSIH
jgi:hypothetical protein